MSGGLTWLSSYPRSGSAWVRVLVTSYLLDVPAPGIGHAAANRVVADLAELFDIGRMVPLGADRPHLVKTHFHPGMEVLQPYRDEITKAVYVVRDPRGVISSHVRLQRLDLAERHWLATEMIRQLAPVGQPQPGASPWSQHVLDWTTPERVRRYFPRVQDVCVVRFEDLRADPGAVLHTVVKFLAIADEVDAGRVRRTVEASSLRDILEARRNAAPDDLAQFLDDPPPPPAEVDDADLSLSDLGVDVEAAYRRRLAEDEELAGLVRRFGYANDDLSGQPDNAFF
jgi:hypothetical protein